MWPGATWPENHRNLCENQGSNADPVEVLMALRDKFIQAPSHKSVVVFCQATGGHDLVRTTKDVALSMDARFYGGIWSIWEKRRKNGSGWKRLAEIRSDAAIFWLHRRPRGLAVHVRSGGR